MSTVPTSDHEFWQHVGVAHLDQAFLLEDDVVQAVMQHLESDGWSIKSFALAHQHGDDIVATRADQRLIVEAKGAGSSKAGTKRFGQPFTRNQVGSHVSVAILEASRSGPVELQLPPWPFRTTLITERWSRPCSQP